VLQVQLHLEVAHHGAVQGAALQSREVAGIDVWGSDLEELGEFTFFGRVAA